MTPDRLDIELPWRTIVRFDKLLTELHLHEQGAPATVCGDLVPNDTSVIWIDWPDDGTPHCHACYGTGVEEPGLFD